MSSPTFSFITASKVIFGFGKAKQVGSFITETFHAKSIKSIFIITGKRQDAAKSLQSTLASYQTSIFSVTSEPTVSGTIQAVDEAKKINADLVISIGGGSAIDLGKAVAMLLENGGEPLDYMEVIGKGQKVSKPSKPFIAIPTTSGTGAEVTKNAVLCSKKHNVKVSLRADTMLPDIAIVDPELVISAPQSVTRSSGLDAFTQNLESFVSILSNPLTDAIAKEGLKYGARSLLKAYTDGSNRQAREDMALCSLFGGMALANAKLGAVHGFAGPLGGMYPNAPHGAVCASLLPYVCELNLKTLKERLPESPALEKYREVAVIITGKTDAKAEDGIAWIVDLCKKMQVPSLSDYGVKKEDFGVLIEKASKSSSMKGNPIKITNKELEDLLMQAL